MRQFWPAGRSEADTIRVTIGDDDKAFQYRRAPQGSRFRATHAFEDAVIVGRPLIPIIDRRRRVVVRLAGVDTPELHYRARLDALLLDSGRWRSGLLPAFRTEYRQHLGETASGAIAKLLRPAKTDLVPCEILVAVNAPRDALDRRGRLGGRVLVKLEEREVDLNLWLVEQGWAFPALYDHMTAEDMDAIVTAARKARRHHLGVWYEYTPLIGALDRDRVFRRRRKRTSVVEDAGPVILPKLFRRLVDFTTCSEEGLFSGDFFEYLKTYGDKCYLRRSLTSIGPRRARLKTLGHFLRSEGRLTKRPEDLVFRGADFQVMGGVDPFLSW